MLASVTQRIREIGIRRAVGATRREILGQFLIEAVVMSGVGGVIGILAGILFGFAIARFAGWKMVFSLQAIVIAVTVSATSGFSSDCIRASRPRRSIDPRHCGMNEPIRKRPAGGAPEEPVEIVSARGAGDSRAGSDRCADRCG